eukprot:365971_1
MTDSLSCIWERKINIEYLVSGYYRLNCHLSFFVPSSILNVISYYYPSMNGHSFLWKINPKELTLSSSSNVIDSDIWNVSLPNKFFLRLQVDSNATQGRQFVSRPRGRGRGRGGRRGRGYRLGRYHNNICFNADYMNTDEIDTSSITDINLVFSLMSFPLPSNYRYIIMHCELYCNQINAECSTIWSLSHDYDDNDNNDYRIKLQANNDKYVKNGWVVNCNKDIFQNLTELTFECKINILKIIYRDPTVRGHNRYPNYDIDDEVSMKTKHVLSPYNYAASGLKNDKDNKMKFVWNIINTAVINKLKRLQISSKGVIQFHSDIFYDIFQLQIHKQKDEYYFHIQICGLPAHTHKMGCKMELFAMNINNYKNKIKILSNIITFSYDSPIYILSQDATNILIDLLNQYNNLSVLCIANIINKYDGLGNTVEENVIEKIEEIQHENNIDISFENKQDEMNNTDDILTDSKWLEFPTQTFVWHITNKNTLDLIKTPGYRRINSKTFELFGHKWFITIHKATDKRSLILIALNCVLAEYDSVECGVTIQLLQTGTKQFYYEKYDGNWTGGYFARIKQRKNMTCRCLNINYEEIQRLNKMSLKLTVERLDHGIINNRKEDKIKMWLCDTVGLPQYYSLFIENGIVTLDILKLLSKQDIKNIGVHKI